MEDLWCAMDGIKLLLEKSGNIEIENDFYKGWICNHHVGTVFVFCPDRTIPICTFNVPGSVHDSKIAAIGRIYRKLNKVFIHMGGKCCIDSAFAKWMHECLIKSGKKDVTDNAIEHEKGRQHLYIKHLNGECICFSHHFLALRIISSSNIMVNANVLYSWWYTFIIFICIMLESIKLGMCTPCHVCKKKQLICRTFEYNNNI